MILQKYVFNPGSPFICVRVETRSNSGHNKPRFVILDEMSSEALEDVMNEYSASEEEMEMQNFRGITWSVIPVSELPEGFFEKRLKSALASLEAAKNEVAWFEAAITGNAKEGVVMT